MSKKGGRITCQLAGGFFDYFDNQSENLSDLPLKKQDFRKGEIQVRIYNQEYPFRVDFFERSGSACVLHLKDKSLLSETVVPVFIEFI